MVEYVNNAWINIQAKGRYSTASSFMKPSDEIEEAPPLLDDHDKYFGKVEFEVMVHHGTMLFL